MEVPLLNPIFCFQCGKFYLGLGDSNFCNNLLHFWIQCLKKNEHVSIFLPVPLGEESEQRAEGHSEAQLPD